MWETICATASLYHTEKQISVMIVARGPSSITRVVLGLQSTTVNARQLLIKALTGQVGTETNMSGKPSNQDLPAPLADSVV